MREQSNTLRTVVTTILLLSQPEIDNAVSVQDRVSFVYNRKGPLTVTGRKIFFIKKPLRKSRV